MITNADDIQVFSGVMDSDTEPRFIAQGNYRRLLNGWNGINEGKFGAIEDAAGNIEIINPDLPAGRNVAIGYFEDVKDNTIIFACWNSNGYHGWYRWWAARPPYANGVIETVWQVKNPSAYTKYNPCPLNFQEDYLITGINLVGDDLYWTDGYNEPKCMDIVRANESNKRRKFEIYFNSENFSVPTTYVLTLYEQRSGATVLFQLIWVASSDSYESRVLEFLAAIESSNAYQFYTVTSQDQYAVIEMNSPGVYHFDLYESSSILNRGGRISYVSPLNFYPDFITGVPHSYAPLSSFHTNTIKAPPDQPDAEYDFDYSLMPSRLFRAAITPITISSNLTTAQGIGFDNDSTDGNFDINNIFTLGAWGTTTVAGWNTTGVGNFFMRFKMQFRILAGTASPLSGTLFINSNGFPVYQIPLMAYNVGDIIEAEFSRVYYSNSTTSLNPFQGFQFSGQSATISQVEVLGGFVEMAPLQQSPRNESIINTAWQFRTIYNYRNNKQTTLSAYSKVPKPYNYEENCIRIGFNDIVNDTVEKFSELTSMNICYSNDAGTTWFNFITINKWELACIKDKYYFFNSKESPIPISEAEALLSYHNVPVLASSQSYIDNRVWYGGLKDGFFSTEATIEFNVTYLSPELNQSNIDTPLISPSLAAYNEFIATYQYNNQPLYYLSRYTGRFKLGLFWKRGWEGKIGIVYYDQYNRSYPVMITGDGIVRTQFWNQTYTGSTFEKETVPVIGWSISSLPPVYAKKYRFARTENFLQRNYLNLYVNATDYVDKDDNSVARTNPLCMYVKINVDTVASYNVETGGSLAFTFEKGDIYRPIVLSNTGIFLPYKEFVIRKVVAPYIYIDNDPNYPALGAHTFEASSVNTGSSDSVFYEFGDYYEIEESVQNGVLVKTHKGQTQDQSIGTSPNNTITPATGVFGYGDGNAWYNYGTGGSKFAPNAFISPYDTVSNIGNGRPNIYIDPATKSFNVEDDLIIRDSTVRFSDVLSEDTQLNGLSAVQPLNEKQYDNTYGLVTKLQVVDNDVLRVIFSNSRMLSIYVKQSRLQQAQDQSPLIIDADTVAGESHLVQRTLGTVNPESVVINDEGDMMGYDETEGVVWRASGNGLIQISDYLQKTNFKNIGNTRMRLDRSKAKSAAIYDLYRDSYILSFNTLNDDPQILPTATLELFQLDVSAGYSGISMIINGTIIFSVVPPDPPDPDLAALVISQVSAYGNGFVASLNPDGTVQLTAPSVVGYSQSRIDIVLDYTAGGGSTKRYSFFFSKGQQQGIDTPFAGTTIEFSKQKNGWTTYYSFVPELFGRLRNNIVSFKDGKMWLHGAASATPKNFYGVQYDRRLKMVSNVNFPMVKQFIGVQVTGTGTNDVDFAIAPYQGIPTGMHSSVNKANFEAKEGIQYAHLMKDDTTPGFRTTAEALINGRPLVGQVCEVEFINDDTTQSTIYSAGIKYFHSEKS